MAEGSELGGFFGKTSAGIPNWGWALVIAGGVLAGFLFTRNKNASTPTATQETVNGQGAPYSGPADQSSQNPILTVPGGAGGSVPVLPTGYVPITDSSGGVIAFEPPASPPVGTTPVSNNPTSVSGVSPLIPYDFFHPHYFPVHPGGVFNYQGVSYYIVSDIGGVIKGVPGAKSKTEAAGKSQVTLYAPSTFYH